MSGADGNWAVASGNPFEEGGMVLYGPFESEWDAAHWAQATQRDEWFVVRVHAPEVAG